MQLVESNYHLIQPLAIYSHGIYTKFVNPCIELLLLLLFDKRESAENCHPTIIIREDYKNVEGERGN